MKRLIVCCDGTWNTPEQEENNTPCPTNVVRIFNAIADRDSSGNLQERYYHPGVGTDGALLSRTAGGMYGEGLDKNTQSAYAWLAKHYEPGDAIYLFGFSRGAYTVRSLGGLIGKCGLPQLQGVSASDAWSRVYAAYQKGYQDDKAFNSWSKTDWKWHQPGNVPVKFIGVWDTVGARGIPDDLAILNLLDRPENWRFYDTRLGDHVEHARHAVAIDEMRASFTPTLWTDANDQPIYIDPSGRIKQLWFPGVHSDVGGGYASCGLSDVALDWMIAEASGAGLAFDPTVTAQVSPSHLGVLHDSAKGIFKALRTRPRTLPCFEPGSSCFHESALARHTTPSITQAPYHRTRKLGVNETTTLCVYAAEHWNRTGIYLEAGASYEFTAEGQWLDRTISCGPDGTEDGQFQLGEVVHMGATLFGKVEGLFNRTTGNDNADFFGTRRIESAPWFSLIGAIANDGQNGSVNPNPDGSPSPHQYLSIGKGPCKVENVARPGYLYAFANDAWHFYGNNRGHVSLTVKRLA